MSQFRHRYLAGVTCLSIWAALGSVSLVRADGLTIAVTEPGGTTIEILDNGPLDSDPNNGSIMVLTDALNPMLTNFNFTSLRTTSNSSIIGARPLLKTCGSVMRATAMGQRASILIQTTDGSFENLTITRLRTSATEMFQSATVGDQLVCRSFLDPLNQPFGTSVLGPMVKGVLPSGHSAAIPAALSQGSSSMRLPRLGQPYSMSSEVAVSLGVSSGDDPRTIDFVGVTSAAKS